MSRGSLQERYGRSRAAGVVLLALVAVKVATFAACGDGVMESGHTGPADRPGGQPGTIMPPDDGVGGESSGARRARAIDSYLANYGTWNDESIAIAKRHELVILHPKQGDVTRALVADLQSGRNASDPSDDVLVFCYVSVGEDLRSTGLDDAAARQDPRFRGDGTGPRIDPRGHLPDGGPLDGVDPRGAPSSGGSGWASYYLDDNSVDRSATRTGDGVPDRNSIFGGFFVNAGDPAWFPVVDAMTLDGPDKLAGLRESLTLDYGRGLGCDGVFLDTIDTAAPNRYTNASSVNQGEFEWTAPGFASFIRRIRETYPDRLILQNRGLFFFDPRHPHYRFTTRGSIDFAFFESVRLNSNSHEEYNAYHFADNLHNLTPKLMAEANRPDGFRVLSLGYAEGPADKMSAETLLGRSTVGLASLLEDIRIAEELAGFRHYLTNGAINLVNSFVLEHARRDDNEPPRWSSTYNDRRGSPPQEPTPRVGVQEALPGPRAGSILVRWDVALDKSGVAYVAYLLRAPVTPTTRLPGDAEDRRVLLASRPESYALGVGPDRFPHEAVLDNLRSGSTYHVVIRAVDRSPAANEDQNLNALSITVP